MVLCCVFLSLRNKVQQSYIGDAFEVSRWLGSRYTKNHHIQAVLMKVGRIIAMWKFWTEHVKSVVDVNQKLVRC